MSASNTPKPGTRRKRKPIDASKQPSSVDQSESETIKNIAQQAFQMMNHSDVHMAYGQHVAAELRRLPEDEALILKSRLTRTMLEFWEERTVSYKELETLRLH